MRNIIKLSLVAVTALSTLVSAATNVSEAFDNATVTGEIKTAYVNSNFLGSQESDSLSAIGGNLGIITEELSGFKMGATFQTSSVLNDGINYTDESPIPPFNVNGASV